MFKILLLFLSCSLFADNKELKSMQRRQKGFAVWESQEAARAEKQALGRARAKEDRQKRKDREDRRRENFKRVERSNRHLEAAYLAAQERLAEKQLARQEKFAQKQKQTDQFKDNYIIPLKALEYDIKDPSINDKQ